jgi:hypothetical protein
MRRQETSCARDSGTEAGQEQGAIQRLIDQIDSIDTWKDRIGRRIVILFVTTFVGALSLLVWSVSHAQDIVKTPGPRVPGVIRSERAPAR